MIKSWLWGASLLVGRAWMDHQYSLIPSLLGNHRRGSLSTQLHAQTAHWTSLVCCLRHSQPSRSWLPPASLEMILSLCFLHFSGCCHHAWNCLSPTPGSQPCLVPFLVPASSLMILPILSPRLSDVLPSPSFRWQLVWATTICSWLILRACA